MTPRSQRQPPSVLRVALFVLVFLMFIVGFLYAFELTAAPIDALIEGIGDIIGQF